MARYYLDYDIYQSRPETASRRPVSLNSTHGGLSEKAGFLVEEIAAEGQIGVYRDPTRTDFMGYAIKYSDQPGYFEAAA